MPPDRPGLRRSRNPGFHRPEFRPGRTGFSRPVRPFGHRQDHAWHRFSSVSAVPTPAGWRASRPPAGSTRTTSNACRAGRAWAGTSTGSPLWSVTTARTPWQPISDWTRCSASVSASYPSARRIGSTSCGTWCRTLTCSSWTRAWPTWTRRPGSGSSSKSRRSTPTSSLSTSPTTSSRWPGSAARSWCWAESGRRPQARVVAGRDQTTAQAPDHENLQRTMLAVMNAG